MKEKKTVVYTTPVEQCKLREPTPGEWEIIQKAMQENNRLLGDSRWDQFEIGDKVAVLVYKQISFIVKL